MADSEKVPEQQQQQQSVPAKIEGTNNENADPATTEEEQEPQQPKQVIGKLKKKWIRN